jgi:hypothetical protein
LPYPHYSALQYAGCGAPEKVRAKMRMVSAIEQVESQRACR